MNRLSDRAFAILSVQLDKLAQNDPAAQIQRDIVKKRLRKLLTPIGRIVSPNRNCDTRSAIFSPILAIGYSSRRQRQTDPPGLLGKLKWVTLFGIGGAGFLMFVNLLLPDDSPTCRQHRPNFATAEFHEYGLPLPAGDRPRRTSRPTHQSSHQSSGFRAGDRESHRSPNPS